jgi:radical SAM superfamily enzyme YgiQ (UPF0313 family)
VITPRWLYVIAAATPGRYGDPLITDETLERFNPETVHSGDVVGIGIHTANALRGFELGRIARDRGAWVVFGGIHATLYPEEAFGLGGAHAVVSGDGDGVWHSVLADCAAGTPARIYDGGRVPANSFLQARLNSSGTYGICEDCGNRISAKRLRAIPWTEVALPVLSASRPPNAFLTLHLSEPALSSPLHSPTGYWNAPCFTYRRGREAS